MLHWYENKSIGPLRANHFVGIRLKGKGLISLKQWVRCHDWWAHRSPETSSILIHLVPKSVPPTHEHEASILLWLAEPQWWCCFPSRLSDHVTLKPCWQEHQGQLPRLPWPTLLKITPERIITQRQALDHLSVHIRVMVDTLLLFHN